MKKVLTTLALACSLVSLSNAATSISPAFNLSVKYGEKFDIKIKNDSFVMLSAI